MDRAWSQVALGMLALGSVPCSVKPEWCPGLSNYPTLKENIGPAENLEPKDLRDV